MAAEANPLLTRMDGWGGRAGSVATATSTHSPSSPDLEARWIPGATRLENGDPKDADHWRSRLEANRVPNPVEPDEVLTEWIGLNIPARFKANVFRGMRAMLDLLPREVVESLGTFKMEVQERLPDDAPAHYDHSAKAIRFARRVVDSYDGLTLRATVWHEMAHWLYRNADLHPRLRAWRDAVAEGPERISEQLIFPRANETFDVVTSIFGYSKSVTP